MITYRRTRPVVVKEFRQILRDRQALAALLFLPAFMLLLFGYALNMDVRHLTTVVYDADHSPASRAMADRFFLGGHSAFFDRVGTVGHPQEVDRYLLSGRAQIGLVIPSGFGAGLNAGRRPAIQVLVDGVNASEAAAAVGYVDAIVQQYALEATSSSLGGGARLTLPIDYRPRVWYNPTLESIKFLLPGLIAFILLEITVITTALSIVRERERGSMEQLMVSPLHPLELVVGKLLPYALIALVSAVFILAAGYFVFGLPMKGSYGLLLLATLLFIAGTLGLGLFISTLVRTQETAFQLALISTLLPTFVLSGFVFPIENMPAVIQVVTHAVPARYYLVIIRGIMLKGVGLEAFWDQLLLLFGFAALVLALGTVRLRRIMG